MNWLDNTSNKQMNQIKNESGGVRPVEFMRKRVSVWGNEKGLTLIELLAVIVILGIISAIAIPAIGGIITSTKGKADDANALLIIDSARYATINDNPTAATTYSLTTLVNTGYMENPPIDPHAATKGNPYDGAKTIVYVTVDAAVKYSYAIALAHDGGTTYAFGDATSGVAESVLLKK